MTHVMCRLTFFVGELVDGGFVINGAFSVQLNYTQIIMTYLPPPPTNMYLIQEVCESLRNDSLTLFVGNHWATTALFSLSFYGWVPFEQPPPQSQCQTAGGGVKCVWRFVTDSLMTY